MWSMPHPHWLTLCCLHSYLPTLNSEVLSPYAFVRIKWKSCAAFISSCLSLFESASPAKSLLAEMYFSPTLVLAALPFLVAAAPLEESPRDGISIPITKRSAFRNADRVVDIAKLQAGVQQTFALVSSIFYRTFANFLTTRPGAGK